MFLLSPSSTSYVQKLLANTWRNSTYSSASRSFASVSQLNAQLSWMPP